ncbi:hypothetical protein MNV49_007833 [Pseudohyphozyma bogoriensis]|nr:hypothetical protein MNV49_007833 [Pseudohyphozyma bogoriensis]
MATKRHKPNPSPVAFTSNDNDAPAINLELAASLLAACLAGDAPLAHELVGQGADAWIQDDQGWTSLHAAASVGDADLVKFLLRKGNAVWNIVDNLGYTAGDIAWSLNEADVYEFLLGEGVRSEMLMAVLGAGAEDEDEDADEEEVEGDQDPTTKPSTASSNTAFLSSKLQFVTDSSGQEVCLDAEGNGVMMGWERGIMEATARELVRSDVRGNEVGDEEDEWKVLNVGFGLGIIDTYLQTLSTHGAPTTHLIIEPHPDVLAHARSKGWFDKPGVRFFEGTWKDYVKKLESGEEEYVGFDAVYFDTYSEHYRDLHSFFSVLPDILSSVRPASASSHPSLFSFFHGLGATSRNLYDVYTTVSELHLSEIGLETEWKEVVVEEGVTGGGAVVGGVGGVRREHEERLRGKEVTEKKNEKGEEGGEKWALTKSEEGEEKRYWGDVGVYRLPVCRLEF